MHIFTAYVIDCLPYWHPYRTCCLLFTSRVYDLNIISGATGEKNDIFRETSGLFQPRSWQQIRYFKPEYDLPQKTNPSFLKPLCSGSKILFSSSLQIMWVLQRAISALINISELHRQTGCIFCPPPSVPHANVVFFFSFFIGKWDVMQTSYRGSSRDSVYPR